MENKDILVRDIRNKQHFIIDDEYLNGYAKLCGINATGVYLCLCRHADFHTQEAYPSIQTMADKLGVSVASVKRGVEKLIEWGIISKKRTRHPVNNKWVNNSYLLLDKSQWKQKPQLTQSHGNIVEPQLFVSESHSSIGASKDSHIKDSHIILVAPTETTVLKPPKEEEKTPIPEALPFSPKEWLTSIIKSDQPHIKLIGYYFSVAGHNFPTKEVALEELAKNLKPAVWLLGNFSKEDIKKTVKYCEEKFSDVHWNLSTVKKQISYVTAQN